MVYLRWQLKHTSGWIEAPGYSRIACLGTWVDQDCLFFYGPPPRLKGIMRLFMLETSVCSHKLLWALAQLSKLREALEQVDQQVVGFVGLVWSTRSKELMFLKDSVSVIHFSNTMQCEKSNGSDRVLWGKVRKPLQSVQSNHGQPCPRLWTI